MSQEICTFLNLIEIIKEQYKIYTYLIVFYNLKKSSENVTYKSK